MGPTLLGLGALVVLSTFQLNAAVPTGNSAKIPTRCIPGYELMPGIGCYKGDSTIVSFEQAESFCEMEGSLLAVPDSEIELVALVQVAKMLGERPWAGVKKVGDRWINVDGKEFGNEEYTGWAPGQPAGTQICSIIGANGVETGTCTASRPFICEQKE